MNNKKSRKAGFDVDKNESHLYFAFGDEKERKFDYPNNHNRSRHTTPKKADSLMQSGKKNVSTFNIINNSEYSPQSVARTLVKMQQPTTTCIKQVFYDLAADNEENDTNRKSHKNYGGYSNMFYRRG